jgi:fructokinase
MGQIVCFGEALIDFLEQTSTAPPQFTQYAGGAPANVAVAVARLGGSAAFVGMLGEDMFGDFLLRSLQQAGVATHYVRRTGAANTALAFVSLDADGERHFSFYRPPAADLLFRPEHFDPACFETASVLHACSNSMTEEASAETTLIGMQRARAAGVLVSFDLNLRPSLWPRNMDAQPRVWQALHAADLVKLSAAEFDFLKKPLNGADGVLQELWKGNAQLLLVTDGAAPIRYFTRTTRGTMPTFRVLAADTTAAGDAFVGGLLYWLVRSGIGVPDLARLAADASRFRETLSFAAACGAFTVTRRGAFAAMPALSDVEELLRARHD